jgi:hypothetical protein
MEQGDEHKQNAKSSQCLLLDPHNIAHIFFNTTLDF